MTTPQTKTYTALQQELQAANEFAKSLLTDVEMLHIVCCIAPIPAGKNHELLTLREEIVVKSIRRATAQAAGIRLASLKAENAELLAALQAAIECGLIPSSSAREGGACAHSRQAQVADQVRDAVAKVTGSAS